MKTSRPLPLNALPLIWKLPRISSRLLKLKSRSRTSNENVGLASRSRTSTRPLTSMVSWTAAPVVLKETPTLAPAVKPPPVASTWPAIVPATPDRSLKMIKAPSMLLSPGMLAPAFVILTPAIAIRVTVLVAPPVVRVTRSKKKLPSSATVATVRLALNADART